MRFSLGTLILVVLWLAAVALVWIQHEAWVPIVPQPPKADFLPCVLEIAPDKTRRIEIRHIDEFPDDVVIVENSEDGRGDDGRVLWQQTGNVAYAYFNDNDTIYINNYTHGTRYHRRHPEWWWGHFYRPEVWVALVLSGALGWKIVRKSRAFRFIKK